MFGQRIGPYSWLRIAGFAVLAVLMIIWATDYIASLGRHGFSVSGFLAAAIPILAACLLILTATRWKPGLIRCLVRAYSIGLGALMVMIGLALTAVLLGQEGESQSDLVMGGALCLTLSTAGGLLSYASVVWRGRQAQIMRLVAWLGLVACNVPFISLRFFLLPLVIAAAPAMMNWDGAGE